MKHKYIFYFYPLLSKINGSVVVKGTFMFFERVSDGKRFAIARGMHCVNTYGPVEGLYKYDYDKVY